VRPFLLLALAICFLTMTPQRGHAEGPPPAGATAHYADLGFSATFPGPAQRVNSSVHTANGDFPIVTVFSKIDGVSYYLVTRDVTGHTKPGDDALSVADRLMDGMLKDRTVTSEPTAVQTAAGLALESVSNGGDGTVIRGRALFAKARTFSVMVIAPKDRADRVSDATATRFLDSLRLD
jgi:hypothetical protein